MKSKKANIFHKYADYFACYGGIDDRRFLYDWVYKIDLDRHNILVRDPVDVTNFISYHMTYTTDLEQYGISEKWIGDEDELVKYIFKGKKDDCDGAAVAVASILFSCGNQDIRIAVGYVGQPVKNPIPNHAYCLLMQENPLLLDATGDAIKNTLPHVDLLRYYTTLCSANPFTKEIWVHGPWADMYGDTQ